MNASQDLHRRLARYYETEPPARAPDWVLQSALSTIESIPQRRGVAALRRYPSMSTYTKLAAAAVVVIAAGGFALWQLAPASPGGQPTPTPTPGATPIVSPVPTASPPRPGPTTYVPAGLTQTFTSDLYGFSLKYPEGWVAGAATERWTDGFLPEFGDPATDTVFDAGLRDHLFVGAGSQPLGGRSLDEWQGEFFGAEDCGTYDAIVVGDAEGWIGHDCDIAMFEAGGRGYIFGLWSSNDDPELRGLDTRALLEEILATVQLHPEDALE